MIKRILFIALACGGLPAGAAEPASAQPAAKPSPAKTAAAKPAAKPKPAPLPDSKKMEQDLQGLPWPQFRAVIEAVPKLKAEVEAKGTAAWVFVQANYKRHGWKKNIDRLDDEQKRQLAELIAKAKRSTP